MAEELNSDESTFLESDEESDEETIVEWSESDVSDGSSDESSDYEGLDDYNIAIHPVNQAPPDMVDNEEDWICISEYETSDFQSTFDDSICGPKHVEEAVLPIDFFNLFFQPRLWNMLVQETNKYAIKHFQDMDTNITWKNTTKLEMKGFISVIFNMGLIRKNRIRDYWMVKYSSQDTPWFRRMFTRARFQQLLRYFHIVDNDLLPNKDDPNYRPSLRLRPILDYFNSVTMHYYHPNQNISIDESSVGSKCRNPIRQYLPNKHHARFGTKVWMLACSDNSYILKLYIYEGAQYDHLSGYGVGYYVIVRLMNMANIYNRGHILYTDNLFTTYNAANFLLINGTFMTGTMRKNQLKHLPAAIVSAKPKVGEMLYYRKDNFLTMSYNQKKTQTKPVVMLSTHAGAYTLPSRKDPDKMILAVASKYNSNMGGIDKSDQILYTYLDERKSLQWTKKVIFNLLMRLAMNSYVIYCLRTPGEKLRRHEYLVQIIESLSKEYKQGSVESNVAKSAAKSGIRQ